ncbi:MAG: cobalt-precorrin-4/precorrin-4 C(11)-methyltransferase [Candidatus Aramenus sulfurataquae]|uniref:Cobalt-precorrin-4/precorrin-4 C(11)-methyltransferase n=2 Tax=Candidatus Aramenus sulfurataquae TaxID=1326980 RepID=A0A0F2LQU9_9CREN|nr:cobalt-precorrin-4/precorrin-4 C(11)-methyltransferase [Candidatus Aramenus sulfurataquae]
MKVYIVGVGPGDPELITLKALKVIRESDVIFYTGSLVSPEIVKLFQGKRTFDTSSMEIEEIVGQAVKEAREGRKVSIVHDGDPTIYGAISEQVFLLEKEGLEVEVVPGVSSFQLSASLLKLELTCPQGPQSVIITRLPYRTDYERRMVLDKNASIVIFLSIHLIDKVKEQLLSVFPADFPVAVVYHAGWPDQKVLTGELKELDELVKTNKIHKTAIIIVSQCLKREERHSNLYSGSFTHSYRRAKQ